VWTGWRRESFRCALAHPVTAVVGLYALLVVLSVVFSVDPRASFRAIPGLSLFLLVPITIDLVDGAGRARTQKDKGSERNHGDCESKCQSG